MGYCEMTGDPCCDECREINRFLYDGLCQTCVVRRERIKTAKTAGWCIVALSITFALAAAALACMNR